MNPQTPSLQTPNIRRGTFGTRFGFYMAAIGSAFGLGNLWRFPYITGANGGGAFVLLYIFFVGIIALPALMSELMLGKLTRLNAVSSLSFKWPEENGVRPIVPAVAPTLNWRNSRRWRWFGRLGLLASVMVLSYYMVVSGWVIHFVVQALMGRFTSSEVNPESIIDTLISKGYLQILLASLHLIVTTSIIARGIQDGIEKAARILMPIFIFIMLGLLWHSMTLPGSREALRFLFYPDFTKLSPTSVIEALGHALFTLSLGFGAMIAYGSYLKPEIHVPTEAVLVASIDTVFSLCAGMLIFPIVFTAHVDVDSGPALLFKTMPVLFRQLSLGYWVSLAFFICLYFAALSASLAIFEGLVAYLIDEKKLKRADASYRVAGVCFALALVSALSGSLFKNVRLGDRGLLEVIDQVVINWMLPIVTLGIVTYVAFVIPDSAKKNEFVDPKSLTSERLFPTWMNTVKYVVPPLILILFLLQGLIALFN